VGSHYCSRKKKTLMLFPSEKNQKPPACFSKMAINIHCHCHQHWGLILSRAKTISFVYCFAFICILSPRLNQTQLISATLLQWEAGPVFCARADGAQNRDWTNPSLPGLGMLGELRRKFTPWMKSRESEHHSFSNIISVKKVLQSGLKTDQRRWPELSLGTEFGSQRPQKKSRLEFGFVT
jgi:hypothetical protein